ncbi:MAG: DUF5996 family protein [Polyangiaceae bacterium]|nr:DUF5996 family protein [Polyangiaceae bacterium]
MVESKLRQHDASWQKLPLAAWRDTRDTLHLWTQIVGKIRLGLSPTMNHWWNVPLYVSARGLTTSAMPCGDRTVEIHFDFLSHELVIEASDGEQLRIRLEPRSVKDFYENVMAALQAMKIDVHIRPIPTEIPNPIPFDRDTVHASYDAEYAQKFWLTIAAADRALQEFRSGFMGKSSPVHFFWGSFDLVVTRFSGRRAPPHGEVPNIPLSVVREAYSHEQASVGFWTGGNGYDDAGFFAYAYPEPPGFADAPVPSPAFYNKSMGEFVMPYEAVRTSAHPDALVRAFAQATYDAAAGLAHWNRMALERTAATPPLSI